MIDHEYTAIFSDDAKDTFEDLKVVLESFSNDEDGLHKVFFSRYFEYKVVTEVLYVLKQEGFLIFFDYPTAHVLGVNPKLEPVSDSYVEAQTFVKLMYTPHNVEYLDTVSDIYGNMFNIFVANDPDSIGYGRFWMSTHIDIIDQIATPEEIIKEMSERYLEVRVQKFKNSVQRVIDTGESNDHLNDNPFANMLFDQVDA